MPATAKARKFCFKSRDKRTIRKGARIRHLPKGIDEFVHQRLMMRPQIEKRDVHVILFQAAAGWPLRVAPGCNTRAGFPATTAPAGTSLVTTLPAPTVAPSPISTPQRMVALEPIDAPRLTT